MELLYPVSCITDIVVAYEAWRIIEIVMAGTITKIPSNTMLKKNLMIRCNDVAISHLIWLLKQNSLVLG